MWDPVADLSLVSRVETQKSGDGVGTPMRTEER